MSLAKPAMRGLLGKRLRFHLPIAFTLSLVAALGFKVRAETRSRMARAAVITERYRHDDGNTSVLFIFNILTSFWQLFVL